MFRDLLPDVCGSSAGNFGVGLNSGIVLTYESAGFSVAAGVDPFALGLSEILKGRADHSVLCVVVCACE